MDAERRQGLDAEETVSAASGPGKSRRRIVLLGAAVVLLIATIALCIVVRSDAHTQPTHHADAIIVLGAGSWRDEPKRVYRARLDHAIELYEQDLAPRIIVTELSPAAEVAQDYLVRRGVPGSAIVVENRSRTTWENLAYARVIMQAHGWQEAIIVTCPFHLHRALRMAHDMGLPAQGGAATASPIEARLDRKMYFTLREAYSYLSYLCSG
jgi:uncharacterized SAM-binding protein YcdF (DUF218 family)